MTLPALRGKHSGRTFILGNGPSLADHDLSKIPEPTFGVNRSFMVNWSTYHVALDHLTFREHDEELRRIAVKSTIFSATNRYPPEADYVTEVTNLGDDIGWSWDMEQGVYPRFSTYMAMQLAVWIGFDDIVLLGTDLGPRGGGAEQRGHFFSQGRDDNPWIGDARFQSECFGYAAGVFAERSLWLKAEFDPEPSIRVRVVSESCPLRCFEKVKFEEVV